MRNDEIMRYFAFFLAPEEGYDQSEDHAPIRCRNRESPRRSISASSRGLHYISHTIGTLLKSRRITDADLELHKIVANLPSKTHVVT